MDIRDRIKAVIESNPDMSVRSVSLEAGLSDSMLNKFLKGETRSPTLETVDKLAKALDVDPRWLAYGEGDPERASTIDRLISKIPPNRMDDAIAVLEVFAKTGTNG